MQINRRGWTLVEMMVVILVISVLVALSLSIGSAVLQGSEEQRTKNALAVLDSAMQTHMVEELGSSFTYGYPGDLALRYTVETDVAALRANGSCGNCNGTAVERSTTAFAGLPTEDELQCFMWAQLEGCETFDSDDDVYAGVSAACFWHLSSHPGSREIIAGMESNLLQKMTYQLGVGDEQEILQEPSIMPRDAWGNPIIIVLPGRDWDDRADGAAFGNPKRQDEDRTIRTKEEQVLGSALQGEAYFVSAGPDGKFGNIHNDGMLVDGFTPNPNDSDFQAALDNIYSYEVHTW